MRIPLPLRVIKNFHSYYLLKYGVLNHAVLTFKTQPDCLKVPLNKNLLLAQWDHVKQLLKLVVAKEIEYHADKNEMVVYSADNQKRKEKFDLSCLASLRYAMDNQMDLTNTEDGLFQVYVPSKNCRFLVRKGNPSDLSTIKVVCEHDEYAFLYPFLVGKLVVDVGANIGDTAVLFIHKGAKQVEAFEIHPLLFNLAKKNIELNGLSEKANIYDYGIGSIDGEMTMRDDSSLGPTAGFGLKEAKYGKQVIVKLKSLSSLIKRLGKIEVLKMDCEGAEFEIFGNLKADDLSKIDVIGLEYHRNPEPLIKKFKSNGFNVKIVSGNDSLGLLLAVR